MFSHYLVAAAVIFTSVLLQSMLGFGAGVTGVPLLALAGFSIPQAVTVVLVASATQTSWGTVHYWEHIDWKTVVRPSLVRLATLPVGNVLLYFVGGLGQSAAKQGVGLVLLGVIVVQWGWRVRPRKALHPAWEWLAFGLSGLLLGFCGMGGPPVVLWVLAHDWSPERCRGTMFATLASGVIPQLLILVAVYRRPVVGALVLGAAVLPWVVLATAVGLRLARHVDQRRWRQGVLVLLVVVALSAILAPLL